jgi:hypothetical protein
LSGSSQAAEFLLVVDQFEEIFTLVPVAVRATFFELIETIAKTPKVRIIVTMRAEFLANAVEMPILAELFRGRGFFSLSAPGVLALTEMIRRPAQMAGYEIRDDLCDRILQDTGTGAGALALMAFALHEVYEHGKASGQFTLQDYESLDGVAGAIQSQAERALERLGQPDDRALHALFSDLMEVNDQSVATRRRAALEQIRKDPVKNRLADALVNARILVTDQERAENPTIEVAHEAVFTGWRRLDRWIESNAGKLRVCRRLTLAARDWQQAGAPSFKHLPDRATLKQYRRIRPACSLGENTEIVGRFLSAARRRQRLWGAFLSFVVIVIVGTGSFFWWVRDYPPGIAVQGLLVRVGLLSAIEPEMLTLPEGSFQMGSPEDEPGSSDSEGPPHAVTFQHPFAIGKYEVTFKEYDYFAAATGRRLSNDLGTRKK